MSVSLRACWWGVPVVDGHGVLVGQEGAAGVRPPIARPDIGGRVLGTCQASRLR